MKQALTIKDKFDAVYSFAKQTSDEISEKYPSVVFVALVGSWARGIPSNEDIDFVIACIQKSDIGKILKDSNTNAFKAPFALRTTFICYPLSTFLTMVFYDNLKIRIFKIARSFRLVFRKLPFLKKILLKLLGSHKGILQKYEILPQTIQTYIPFFDKEDTLKHLQKKQRAKLETELSESDLLLYSQNGFQKLIDHYLLNKISKENVKNTLIESDIDWKEYLNRVIEVKGAKEKELIYELRDFVLVKT